MADFVIFIINALWILPLGFLLLILALGAVAAIPGTINPSPEDRAIKEIGDKIDQQIYGPMIRFVPALQWATAIGIFGAILLPIAEKDVLAWGFGAMLFGAIGYGISGAALKAALKHLQSRR